MELFSEPLIEKWQQTITRDFCKSHSANIWLFHHDREEYFNFVLGCVGEGIARAIYQKEKHNEEAGSFYFFCSLKSFEVIRDELRKEHRRRKSTSPGVLKDLFLLRPQVLDHTRQTHLREHRQRFLAPLSPDQRDVLLLVDYVGCSPKEAGAIMQRTVDAVYSLLKRARRSAAKTCRRQEQSTSDENSEDNSPRGSRRPRDGLSDSPEPR